MKLLIKQAYIADPASPHHGTPKDLFIENGFIKAIADSITEQADHIINLPELAVSPGWMDPFANFCDPGYEFKETLATGASAAAAGGFTTVFVVPNTKPVIDAKTQVEYIVQQSTSLPVQLMPLGAITRGAEGRELAEMYDMHNSGARAFSDGTSSTQQAGILLKALQYIKSFNGVIIQVPDDKTIAPHGLINEGIVSTRLGLPGKPALAEELMVSRDIELARYADSRLHFTGISLASSVDCIKRAKDAGINITCSVTPYHLAFCDEDLMSYDTNLKVSPPLRTRKDMMALRAAVINGDIDCIATHHQPQDWDNKTCEFEYARYGMLGLQTCYPLLRTLLPELSSEQWVALLSSNARKIFALDDASVRENAKANLTLFQPNASWTFGKEQVKSKSFNTPFIDKTFTGKVTGIVNGEKFFLNQS